MLDRGLAWMWLRRRSGASADSSVGRSSFGDDKCLWQQILTVYSQRWAPDTQIESLMAAVLREFICVSIVNVTFLPGFHREALKRALNRKQGTSENSQATGARWIIQSRLTTCCHVCRELPHMQSFTGVYVYAEEFLCSGYDASRWSRLLSYKMSLNNSEMIWKHFLLLIHLLVEVK